MSFKILTDKDREEQRVQKEKEQKQKKKQELKQNIFNWVLKSVKSSTFKVCMACIGIFLVAVVARDFKVQKENLYTGVIDWSKLSVASEDIDMTDIEKVDGTIGFDAYLELRKERARKTISSERDIMSNAMYENLMDGIESKYFYDSMQADYNDLCTGIQGLITQSQWIIKLHEAYENEIGIADSEVDYCLIPETEDDICELKDFILSYTYGELQEFLMDAHDKWETLTNYRSDKVLISDDYANLLYQESVCTDMSTITKLDGDVLAVGKDLYDAGPAAINTALEEGKLERIKITEKSADVALEELGLYHDINFFDDDFATLAPDTITALFTEDMIGSNTEYIGQNVSIEDVIGKLESGEIGSNVGKSDEEIENDELEIDNYKSITFSLTGRDDRDIYYLFFKVNDCKHDVSQIASREERDEELKKQSSYIEAQKDISTIITAEVEDLDIQSAEDIKNYFPEFVLPEEENKEVVSNVPIENIEEALDSLDDNADSIIEETEHSHE